MLDAYEIAYYAVRGTDRDPVKDVQEVEDMIEGFAAEKYGWKDLDKEPPKKGQYILLYDRMFDKIDPWFVDKDPERIDPDYTHWMLRPAPPKD